MRSQLNGAGSKITVRGYLHDGIWSVLKSCCKPSLDPDRGVDRRGLGSYCSLVTTGKTAKPVRVVTYYRPSDESRHKEPKKGRQTVFTQHIREFKRQGILDKDPRLEADRCLIEDLKSGRQTVKNSSY